MPTGQAAGADTTQQPHLLIDARNVMYRAIYATKANKQQYTIRYHNFVRLLRHITEWINVHRPRSVHVFWDAPRETVWRRKVSPTYKDRTDSEYVEDISQDLQITTIIAKEFFACARVRQYERPHMEADDLIYAMVTMVHPQPTIVVSTDGDMTQLAYMFSSCSVYDPKKHEIVKVPEINPVIQKALAGDVSDSIDGYYGIGPKKSAILAKDPLELHKFLASVDKNIYYANLLLIDLSLNPRLLANKLYVQRRLAEFSDFDEPQIQQLIQKHKITGMLSEYANLVPPFKRLV